MEKEFNKQPDKIMGCLIEGGMAPSGKNVYKLIVGSAIYPAGFLDTCGLAANLYNYNLAYQNSEIVPEPWDVRCRWVFMQNGRNTDLIKAYWKSCNYQRRGEDIVFFAEDPEAQEIQSVTCPDGKVDPRAVVVHGCKDGSLHKMVLQTPDSTETSAQPMPIKAKKPRIKKPKTPMSEDQKDFIKQLNKLAKNVKAKKAEQIRGQVV